MRTGFSKGGWHPVVRLAFRDDLYEQLHDLLVGGGWPCDLHPRTFVYDWTRRVRRRVA